MKSISCRTCGTREDVCQLCSACRAHHTDAYPMRKLALRHRTHAEVQAGLRE